MSLEPAKISAVSAAGGTGPGSRQTGLAKGAQAGGAQRWQQALWQQLSSCMDALHAPVVAMWHLQRVLAKKRDPIMHVCFLDFLLEDMEGEDQSQCMLSERVWAEVVLVLTTTLNNAFSSGSGVKEALVLGYPRLAALLDATFARIARDTDVKGVPPAVHKDSLEQLHQAAAVFQKAYLGRTRQRLTDAVKGLFTVGGRGASNVVAGAAEVAKVARILKEELDSAQSDARVIDLIAGVAAQAIRLLGEKCEDLIAAGPEAHQVTMGCTVTQERNLQLCVLIQEVHSAVAGVLGGLSPGAAETLKTSVAEVDKVAYESLTPLFKAVGERFENSLTQMHKEKMEGDSNTTECSKYMEDMLRVMAYFNGEFLERLTTHPSGLAGTRAQFYVASGLTQTLAQRVLELFVRHASLMRPLSEVGKLRLAKDMAELELAVGQNLFPVEQLGAPYRSLRAFRPLLFLDTAQLLTSPLLKEMPTSVVLHHLYARAPAELVSPHKRADLSATQYSLWLDQHSEEEVWRGVKGTLDAYAQAMQVKGQPVHEVHGIMLSLGASMTN
uniref:Conserved oligomeric Golgi complex subunit 5 helical domain-containing protein n=1 Tax=Pyramimonas obovata TaxID=1411642 RepID=A0A7S0R0D9_9CHLO